MSKKIGFFNCHYDVFVLSRFPPSKKQVPWPTSLRVVRWKGDEGEAAIMSRRNCTFVGTARYLRSLSTARRDRDESGCMVYRRF